VHEQCVLLLERLGVLERAEQLTGVLNADDTLFNAPYDASTALREVLKAAWLIWTTQGLGSVTADTHEQSQCQRAVLRLTYLASKVEGDTATQHALMLLQSSDIERALCTHFKAYNGRCNGDMGTIAQYQASMANLVAVADCHMYATFLSQSFNDASVNH
jgi:hypothetical protein